MAKTGSQKTTKADKSTMAENSSHSSGVPERRLEALLNVVPSGIVIIESPDGKISYVNKRAIELYGVDPRGLQMESHSTRAMKLLTADGDVYLPERLPASRALLHGETVRNEELLIEQPWGTRVTVSASAAPVIDDGGNILAAVGIFHDISRRKQTQAALRDHQKNLQRLVVQQTQELLRANKELKREMTEHQQAVRQVRALSLRLVNAEEKERQRVGQELHDQIGGSLTLLKLAMHKARQGRPEKTEASLAEIEEIVNEIYEQVRSLSHSLRPDMLTGLGLVDALDAHFEDYTNRCGVKVHFKPTKMKRRLSSEVEITAFRIVQEALVNVARHAKASEVNIHMTCQRGRLSVQIRDDGCGFDPAQTESLSSGISGMQGRAYLMDGTVTVDSSPGVGTCITCELPLTPHGHRPTHK